MPYRWSFILGEKADNIVSQTDLVHEHKQLVFIQIRLSVFVKFAKCISWEDSGCTVWPNKACRQSLSPRELQILQSEVEPNTAQIIPLMSPTSKQTMRFAFGTKMQLTQFCWKSTILRGGRSKCNSYKPVQNISTIFHVLSLHKHFAYHSSRSLAPLWCR